MVQANLKISKWKAHAQGHEDSRIWASVAVCVCVCVCVCTGTCAHMLTQSCPNLCNPMDCSPPGSSVHKIFQARILEWVAISFSRGSSRPRDQTHISHLLYLLHGQAGSLPAEQPRETIWGSRLRQSQREWVRAASHRRKGGNWIELRMRFLGWWECSRSSVGWLAQKYTQ